MHDVTIASAAIMLAVGALASSQGDAALFSEAQAERGRSQYATSCARCHGEDLAGSFEIPTLKERYIQHWRGARMSDVVDYIEIAMPIDRPGSLGAQAATDITAYLLQANGYPAGQDELPADRSRLRNIILY